MTLGGRDLFDEAEEVALVVTDKLVEYGTVSSSDALVQDWW